MKTKENMRPVTDRGGEFGIISPLSIEKRNAFRNFVVLSRKRAAEDTNDRMTPDSLAYLEFSRLHDTVSSYEDLCQSEESKCEDVEALEICNTGYKYIYTAPDVFKGDSVKSIEVKKTRRKKVKVYLCAHCGTAESSLWRRLRITNLCNACSLYHRLHGFRRPLSLVKPIIRRRLRQKKTPLSPINYK